MTDEPKSEMQKQIEGMAPDQFDTLKSMVDGEHGRRSNDAARAHRMTDGEFAAWSQQVLADGDRARQAQDDKVNAQRRAEFERNRYGAGNG
jgi:hypothetical protein